MRIPILLIVSLLIYNTCLANEKNIQNDTVLMRLVDSIFINLIENKLSKSKLCLFRYKDGSADIDVWDYTYEHLILDIDSSFANKVLKYSLAFCADSIDYVNETKKISHILKSEKYQFEFYYKEKDAKTTSIICIFYGQGEYISLNNRYQD
jgi:hypothetical protein